MKAWIPVNPNYKLSPLLIGLIRQLALHHGNSPIQRLYHLLKVQACSSQTLQVQVSPCGHLAQPFFPQVYLPVFHSCQRFLVGNFSASSGHVQNKHTFEKVHLLIGRKLPLIDLFQNFDSSSILCYQWASQTWTVL